MRFARRLEWRLERNTHLLKPRPEYWRHRLLCRTRITYIDSLDGVEQRSERNVHLLNTPHDERYAPYVQAAEKQKLLASFKEAEDWLYTDEGEDSPKSAYVARLDALKVLGGPPRTCLTMEWYRARQSLSR
ncbi:hypothetical protein Hypma_003944 [Hypsizygus marmoreus]|uniref:Uncharacterized protein n=1 Tax=Hypsizygus marmoreus TaxID=39966 RepID=A0A369J140_HYPMA|nr:hypothetical protein Hypma_003944 [Hypsizygus marmoreus]